MRQPFHLEVVVMFLPACSEESELATARFDYSLSLLRQPLVGQAACPLPMHKCLDVCLLVAFACLLVRWLSDMTVVTWIDITPNPGQGAWPFSSRLARPWAPPLAAPLEVPDERRRALKSRAR